MTTVSILKPLTSDLKFTYPIQDYTLCIECVGVSVCFSGAGVCVPSYEVPWRRV